MVKIKAEKSFKYEGEEYEKGKEYDVSEEIATKAVGGVTQ